MSINDDGLNSTIVGSFPLQNMQENMARTILDQASLGIDYICYGQLESMISQFLTPLSLEISPLVEEKGIYLLSDDFKIPNTPIAVHYGEYLTKLANEHEDLFRDIKGLKACLTGPFTLASEIILRGDLAKGLKALVFKEPRAIMVDWIIDKLADIMKQVGKAYSDMGINLISMDEPILSLLVGKRILFHSEEFIIRILNKAISGIEELSSIHVCGQISPKLRDLLLQTEVNILDHEFQTSPKNLEIFQKQHFNTENKYLAYGAVRTKFQKIEGASVSEYVEPIPTIKRNIEKVADIYGKENLFIKPDCGFLSLRDSFEEEFAYQIAIKKLQNMVSAIKIVR
ncbi:MAG: putative methylcobalamin:homocysteine methyltransferase [Promethearchaeota archaeon]|nr:MAG: putative methylcobalamin:homocysteine methyltransferase [Candidatus Lokiarchaeota archaeon]